MIPPYTAFLDGNTGIFLQQKMLSAAQITYSSEQFPPAWRQDQRHAAKQHIKSSRKCTSPNQNKKGLKTIVRTDFRKTFPSSPQTGQRMSQNSKKSKTSVEKVLHLLVSYTLFPAPSPFSSRSCGGEWNQEFPHPFPPEQSLKICLSYCRSGITPYLQPYSHLP